MAPLPPAPSADALEQHRPRYLRHILPFIELADEANVDVDGLLRELGLDRRALNQPRTKLPYYQMHWLLEELCARCGDPEIGLRAAERTPFLRSDFLGHVIQYVLQMTSDLLTVMQFLAHFGTYVARNGTMTVTVDADTVTVTTTPVVPPPPELYDWFAGAGCALWQTLGGAELRPLEVRLPRPCPTTPQRYEAFFGARVVFDAPRFESVYARAALSTRLGEESTPDAMPVAAPIARAGNALALQVRTHVLARLTEGVPLLPAVAKKLGLSARTLRRRLSEVRSSYAELVDEVRRERALTLASRPELDVGRLAELTGFTDASAFARAFRRWTGERPREYMRRARTRVDSVERA